MFKEKIDNTTNLIAKLIRMFVAWQLMTKSSNGRKFSQLVETYEGYPSWCFFYLYLLLFYSPSIYILMPHKVGIKQNFEELHIVNSFDYA